MRGLEKGAEFGAGEVALDTGELLDRVAEVDEQRSPLWPSCAKSGDWLGRPSEEWRFDGARGARKLQRGRDDAAEASRRRHAGQSKRNI